VLAASQLSGEQVVLKQLHPVHLVLSAQRCFPTPISLPRGLSPDVRQMGLPILDFQALKLWAK
jgi:hypothetical protein